MCRLARRRKCCMVGDKYPWRTRPCQGVGYTAIRRCRAQALMEERVAETPMQSPHWPALRRINAIAAAETTCLICEPRKRPHFAGMARRSNGSCCWSGGSACAASQRKSPGSLLRRERCKATATAVQGGATLIASAPLPNPPRLRASLPVRRRSSS